MMYTAIFGLCCNIAMAKVLHGNDGEEESDSKTKNSQMSNPLNEPLPHSSNYPELKPKSQITPNEFIDRERMSIS